MLACKRPPRTNGLNGTLPLLPPEEQPPLCKRKKLQPSEVTKLRQQRKKYVAPSQNVAFGDKAPRIVRGRGQYLIDECGQQYLDTLNNVSHVGHCHPKVVEAGARQMATLNTNSRFLYDQIAVYAKKLASTLPGKLSVCYFTNSGSEANDLALQIAKCFTGHTEVISLEGCYHGHLESLRALSTYKSVRQEPKERNDCIAPLPDTYSGKYRDPETAGQLYADEVQRVIQEQREEGKSVAAFICESIPSCAGQVFLPDGFMQKAFEYVREAGGLCIADEVQTGFGRVGTHFWAFETQGVVPDIVTLGKPIGNGHPVAAVVTTKEIADVFARSGTHYFNTFGGNPVSMAIADAVLQVIQTEHLQENAQEVGSFLLSKLKELEEKHSCVANVRGMGLFIGLDIVNDKKSREPSKRLADMLVTRLLAKHHMFILADGIHGNVIKIKPPMCFTKENSCQLVEALDVELTILRSDL